MSNGRHLSWQDAVQAVLTARIQLEKIIQQAQTEDPDEWSRSGAILVTLKGELEDLELTLERLRSGQAQEPLQQPAGIIRQGIGRFLDRIQETVLFLEGVSGPSFQMTRPHLTRIRSLLVEVLTEVEGLLVLIGGELQDKPSESIRWDGLQELTSREREVLALMIQGLTNLEIAGKLFISVKTVKNYVSNIYRKLGTSDRTQLALAALRSGLAVLH